MSKRFVSLFVALLGVILFGQSSVKAEPLDLVVSMDQPATVVYGHQPINVVVKIFNPTVATQTFSGTAFVGGPAWSGETGPIGTSYGTAVTWMSCNGNGCRLWWSGNIPAGKMASLSLNTSSSDRLGTYELSQATLFDAAGNVVVDIRKNITLTVGSGVPNGKITPQDNDLAWRADWYKSMILTLESPTITTFSGELKSDCGILGLNRFNVSGRTIGQIYISNAYMPVNVPAGTICTVSAKVTTSEGVVFTPSVKFTVTLANAYRPQLAISTSSRVENLETGKPVELTYIVHNYGSAAAPNTTVNIALGQSIVKGKDCADRLSEHHPTSRCNLGTVTAGATLTRTITVQFAKPEDQTLSIAVNSDLPDAWDQYYDNKVLMLLHVGKR